MRSPFAVQNIALGVAMYPDLMATFSSRTSQALRRTTGSVEQSVGEGLSRFEETLFGAGSSGRGRGGGEVGFEVDQLGVRRADFAEAGDVGLEEVGRARRASFS